MTTVAISQPNHIPWRGYFDLMDQADHFVFFDDVQYTRRDWRNRNVILLDGQKKWMSIPVKTKGLRQARINDILVLDRSWAEAQVHLIEQAYRKAPHFNHFYPEIRDIFLAARGKDNLSEITVQMTNRIASLIGISTPSDRSSRWPSPLTKSERLLDICLSLSATEYLSGPAAKAYLDESIFEAHGITVRYMDYTGYRPYPQFSSEFQGDVSILDLLFQTGAESLDFIRQKIR